MMTHIPFNTKLPATIENHHHRDFLGMVWHEVHNNDGICTIVICGRRGKGKSWTALELAHLLDRTLDDVTRFSIEREAFCATDFLKWLNADDEVFPPCSVVVLDDAGMFLYSKDALTKIIKNINKTLQNIRSVKNPIIIIALPAFKWLEIDAREMSDIYIEVVDRDKANKQNLCKIQILDVNPFTGKLYRHNLGESKKLENNEFKVPLLVHNKPLFRFGAPPKELSKEYKRMSNEEKKRINAKLQQEVHSLENGKKEKQKKMTVQEEEALLKANALVLKKSKFSVNEIRKVLDCGYTKATIWQRQLKEMFG